MQAEEASDGQPKNTIGDLHWEGTRYTKAGQMDSIDQPELRNMERQANKPTRSPGYVEYPERCSCLGTQCL